LQNQKCLSFESLTTKCTFPLKDMRPWHPRHHSSQWDNGKGAFRRSTSLLTSLADVAPHHHLQASAKSSTLEKRAIVRGPVLVTRKMGNAQPTNKTGKKVFEQVLLHPFCIGATEWIVFQSKPIHGHPPRIL
jgi:hypothetical protein